jgi:hypothetical protein
MTRLILPTILALTVASTASAQLVTFDTPNDFTNNFTSNGGYTQTTDSGVNGSGGLTVGGNPTAIYNPGGTFAGFNLAVGQSITISEFIRPDEDERSSGGFGAAHTGLFTANTGAFSDSSAGLGGRLQGAGGADGTLLLAYRNNGGNTAIADTNFTLADNTWYKLSTTLQKSTTADLWNLSMSVEDWGLTGTAFVSTVKAGSATGIANNALYTDTSAFAGFSVRNEGSQPRDFVAADNFQVAVVPEPGTVGLLLLSSVGVMGLRRRRGVALK